MMKMTTLLFAAVLGFSTLANADCTVYIEPIKSVFASVPSAVDKKEREEYQALVKVLTNKGWTVSPDKNKADITAYASCVGDLGNMLATIGTTDNRTKEEIYFEGADYGFFVDGRCTPAIKDAAKEFPICE